MKKIVLFFLIQYMIAMTAYADVTKLTDSLKTLQQQLMKLRTTMAPKLLVSMKLEPATPGTLEPAVINTRKLTITNTHDTKSITIQFAGSDFYTLPPKEKKTKQTGNLGGIVRPITITAEQQSLGETKTPITIVCTDKDEKTLPNPIKFTPSDAYRYEFREKPDGQWLFVAISPRIEEALNIENYFKHVMGINEYLLELFYREKFEAYVWLSLDDSLSLPGGEKWQDKIKSDIEWNTFRNEQIAQCFEPATTPKKPHFLKQLKIEDGKLVDTGKKFQMGYLEQLSIKSIRDDTKSIASPGGGTFNIIHHGKDPENKLAYFVDAGALQANSANKNAVFLVETKFNLLHGSQPYEPYIGISSYLKRELSNSLRTRMSALPGTILCNLFAFDDKKEASAWRQTALGQQINLLSDLQDVLVVDNGVIDLVKSKVKNPSLAFKKADYEKIKIGYLHDTQITGGRIDVEDGSYEPINNPAQLIDQVFVGTLDCNKLENKDSQAPKIARSLLLAAYEGIIKGTQVAGKTKTFLRLIGLNSGNELDWVIKALEVLPTFIVPKGLEVYLVISHEDPKLTQPDIERLVKLVTNTGGTYTMHYMDGDIPTEKELTDAVEIVSLS